MKYLLLLILPLFLLECKKEEDTIIENPPTDLSTSVEYKQMDSISSNLLSLDIYYNSLTEQKKPVVLYVHGGGWSIGDKSSQIENKISLFQSLDYLFVSINYRLSPFPFEPNNSNRIKFPAHNNDVADAIKWVINNISKYGGDQNKIALLGHSAGAHLVSLTATNSTFLTNVGLNFSNIKGVAAIDTEGYDVLSQVQNNNALYINAFGIDTNSNAQASPILNLTSGISYPKFFIAKRGSSGRIARADNFINTLVLNGVSVSQIDGSIYDHSGINDAIGKPNETLITNALKQFLTECFQ